MRYASQILSSTKTSPTKEEPIIDAKKIEYVQPVTFSKEYS